MKPHIPYYHPREVPHEILEKMLVGREALLTEIMTDLRRQATSATRQHWLLRGQRGIGKTHLSGIIYYRVRKDAELSRAFLPIWLGETEGYEVYSAGVLLLKVAERLVEELRLAKDQGADELRRALEALPHGGDDEALFMECAEILGQEARRRGQVLLVLLENLDATLGSFSPKKQQTEMKRFRHLLLHDRAFLFLSTTPTRYLRLSDPKEPLFGHLREEMLQPLSQAAMVALFVAIGEITGRQDLARSLAEGPEAPVRQRVLHQLSGGLPRSLVIAFEALSEQGDISEQTVQEVVESFRRLLDRQTAYFEARLARLAPREAAIVTQMALARGSLTLQEIAQVTRLPERSLSTLVRRLVDEGHIEMAYGGGGKGTLYGLTDGLFRIWYQYRKGRLTLRPLIEFIASWCKAEELAAARERLAGRIPETRGMDRHLAEMTLLQIEEAYRIASTPEGQRRRNRLWSLAGTKKEGSNDSKDWLHPEVAKALSSKAKDKAKRIENAAAQCARSIQETVQQHLEERKPILLRGMQTSMKLGLEDWWVAALHVLSVLRPMIESEFMAGSDGYAQFLLAGCLYWLGKFRIILGQKQEAREAFHSLQDRLKQCTDPNAWDLRCFSYIDEMRIADPDEAGVLIAQFIESMPGLCEEFWRRRALGEFCRLCWHFPSKQIRAWIDQAVLANREDETIEFFRLQLMVLDVVDAARGQGKAGKSRGDAYRQALARLPPELRPTVESIVTSLTDSPETAQ